MLQVLEQEKIKIGEGRKDYTDKSDPVRENDCIWCMACVTVCPTQAIKVDEANLDVHKKTATETAAL